ncbi:MAG: peptidylprolyl isomerase [Taibaiella sp.]|nr:peptidylprolyl isomerase [Taibaiella sp.]
MNIPSVKNIYTLGRAGIISMLLLTASQARGQESADKIITVVGRNRIILQSEIEKMFMEAKLQDPTLNDTMKCAMLQQSIMKKMLLEQAERDSLLVTEEDVDGQLDNRLRYFIQMYGSKEKLEQMSGKTVYQIKEEFRETIREDMVAEKMQGQILENSKITPAEVADFYRRIPLDSLPFFPAIVEVGQIVINPTVSPELEEYAHSTLEGIKKKIIDSEITFENAAIRYTDDPGSRDNGGRYDGITRTGPWAPEFVAAAFKLQNGEISPIFKTKFGFHILQMINRKGDEADVRHILIKPAVSTADFKVAIAKLDSIHTLLTTGKMGFSEAVGKFSTDEGAKRTGGMIADPNTGTTELDITKLDPGMVLMLDSMKQGDFSKPHIFLNELHEQSCRIVYLRNRTSPHKANLRDDYSRIQEVALSQKKATKMQNWIKAKLPTFYLWIDPAYQNCNSLKELVKTINSEQ